MAERYTKTYVSVNVDIDEDGTMLPRLIRWMNGRVFAIEQLGYKCRASSAKVGGGGIRYTVRINGRETYLLDSLLSAEADGREYGVHRGEQERRDDDGREAEHDAEIEILRDEEQRHQRQPSQKNELCVCPTGEENQIGWPFLYCFHYT